MCLAKFVYWIVVLAMLLAVSGSALAHSEMEHIKLKVYMNPAGAPFSFFTDNLNKLHGIDIDIVREMQNRLGFELMDNRMYPLDDEFALERMLNKEIDFYGGGVPFNQEFSSKFAALPIYIKSSLGVLYSAKNHPNLRSVKDLKGFKIGVIEGSAAAKFVPQFGGATVPISNLSYAVFMVSQGRLDAIIYDRMILNDFAKTTGNRDFMILPDEFGKDLCQYTFYISKLSPYRRLLTSTLQNMLNDGTIDKILIKWGVEVKQPLVRKSRIKKTS